MKKPIVIIYFLFLTRLIINLQSLIVYLTLRKLEKNSSLQTFSRLIYFLKLCYFLLFSRWYIKIYITYQHWLLISLGNIPKNI
jgi:hypothetical protein